MGSCNASENLKSYTIGWLEKIHKACNHKPRGRISAVDGHAQGNLLQGESYWT